MTTEFSDPWLRGLVDTAVDGIVVIDERGTVQLFNRACEMLFGYESREVIGRNVNMLMPEPYHTEHDAYLKRYRETGDKRIIGIGRHVAGRRADGTVFPMYLSVGAIHDPVQGRAFVGIIRDETETRAAEEALRDQAVRLRSTLETVPDAIIVIDERGIIDSFSPSAERLFGWTTPEIRGKNVSALMPPPYRENHDSYIERYRRTGERRIIGIGRVVVGLRRNGSTFPMELQVGEMRILDRRMFTGFVRDLTERTAVENRLQNLQAELLHVSRLSAMGQMASALSHELNQPLTAVINWTQVARRLARGLEQAVPAKMLEAMDKAIDQANRAGQIIHRLRAFLEKREGERASEDANKVLEEAAALALVGSVEHGIRTHFELESDLPRILVDKVQVQQVIVNLIRNALEAMAESTTRVLTVCTRRAGPEMVEVEVSDTGPGLAPEVVGQLFQPFVTTKSTGMGLGLSLSQSIIEAQGGRLKADTNESGGMSFSFTLPAVPEEGNGER
jgi:two-component system sensor kinase FixL